jgi:phosphoglucomutase
MEDSLPSDPFIVKTIVSTDLVKRIASKYGVEVKETLTGFKFIGEIIEKAEMDGKGNYLFGFEESYGSLFGKHARDKDAVSAAALACAIGGHLKRKEMTLIDYLEEIYSEFGYFQEALVSKEYEGIQGKEKIELIMTGLRHIEPSKLKDMAIRGMKDYLNGYGNLPPSDVISMEMENDCKIIVRPSGTEPKIKFYLMARGENREEAEKKIEEMKELVERIACL